MITAQDIREKTFDKAKFGGYDMASVDDFLEDLAEEVTASQKENAVLKSKMKILVDKIEEYRANEEALNMAVLSAQKLAVQIESEARARANAMLAEADRQVNAKIGSIAEQADAEENRLAAAKSATLKFLESMREVCNKQLKNIEDIGNGFIPEEKAAAEAAAAQAAAEAAAQAASAQAAAPAPAASSIEDAVRSIERSVSRIQPEESVNIDISPAIDVPAKPESRLDSTQHLPHLRRALLQSKSAEAHLQGIQQRRHCGGARHIYAVCALQLVHEAAVHYLGIKPLKGQEHNGKVCRAGRVDVLCADILGAELYLGDEGFLRFGDRLRAAGLIGVLQGGVALSRELGVDGQVHRLVFLGGAGQLDCEFHYLPASRDYLHVGLILLGSEYLGKDRSQLYLPHNASGLYV